MSLSVMKEFHKYKEESSQRIDELGKLVKGNNLLSFFVKLPMSLPSNRIDPLDCSRPKRPLAKEDLPEPDSPTRPVVDPE